jgi:D-3-phosphoglycerate dehydrogenase
MNKILIIDRMHESITPMLQEIGYSVDYRPSIRREEIMQILPEYTGILVRSKTPIDAELLRQADQLRFVGRAGAGIDQLDVEELDRRNIAILNAPEGNRDALGEHALGMLLCLANNINTGDLRVRQRVWDREGHRGFEVKGKTVALIGFGQMGSAFAEKLSGLACRVIAYDKYKTNFATDKVEQVSMEDVFEQADIVSFHVPLTTETRTMVNQAYLERFKKPIVLLNTSRGEVVSLSDLLQTIESGKVKAAALDVLENEKLDTLTPAQKEIFDRLILSDKVLLTPHVGGWTFESYERINAVLVEKIAALGKVE